jgi:hypothetical protein
MRHPSVHRYGSLVASVVNAIGIMIMQAGRDSESRRRAPLFCVGFPTPVPARDAATGQHAPDRRRPHATVFEFAGAVLGWFSPYLQNVYQFIAVKMTDRENHRSATAYEDALIVKLFLFQFVNHYSSFYYLAFVHIQPFHVRELGNCIAGPAPTTPATYAPTPAPSIMLNAEQVSAGCLQARRNATRRGTTRAVATLLFVC